MKKRKGIFVGILITAVAVGGVMVLKNMTGGHGLPVSEQAVLYHCPMHPSYVSDKPGDCPICGMKLVKVEPQKPDTTQAEGGQRKEGGHEGHAARKDQEGKPLTPAQKAKSICLFHECPMLKEGRVCPMLIFTEEGKPAVCPVCKRELTGEERVVVESPKDIMEYAAITIDTTRQQLIGIRTSPVVSKPAVKVIRTVGKIAYDPELYQAEQEYLEAIQAYEKARAGAPQEIRERSEKLVQATQTKLELLGLSEDLIEEVRDAGVPDLSLILARPGGTVWLYAPVYEQELDIVKAGQKVTVTSPHILPGKKFFGTVRSLDPVLDPKTRSVRLRAVLDNSEGYLKPNAYVDVEIEVNLGTQLLIPKSAVLDSGERKIAFVARGNGVFEPRLLILGPELEDDFVVISGVTEGEEVVHQATFFVDSESRLQAAIGQMAGGMHTHHGS